MTFNSCMKVGQPNILGDGGDTLTSYIQFFIIYKSKEGVLQPFIWGGGVLDTQVLPL